MKTYPPLVLAVRTYRKGLRTVAEIRDGYLVVYFPGLEPLYFTQSSIKRFFGTYSNVWHEHPWTVRDSHGYSVTDRLLQWWHNNRIYMPAESLHWGFTME